MRYLTEAWAEAALLRMETDPQVAAALKGIRLSLLTIILDPPRGCYGFIYAAFDREGLADYRVGHDYHVVTEGIAPPTFVVSGPYSVFAAIQQGRVSERRALLTGKLHLTGSMVRALRHMKALEAITSSLRQIECAV